jgi:hypothetical protein
VKIFRRCAMRRIRRLEKRLMTYPDVIPYPSTKPSAGTY